ncbi:MAG: hypothetical protein Q4C58_00995 [Eubacteriales bacterium]|nr:hypothetical protein [Eubacteriales bacterium]
MKMKKIVAATLVFVLSAGNMVYASAAEPTPGNNTAEILATYNEEEPDPAIVYSVDVEWGSLEYTYDSGKTLTWNPETLKYVETVGTSTWSCEENADKITVTNNSNTEITATLSYEQIDSNISGKFDQAKIDLKTAEGTTAGSGPSGTATLSLNGALSDTATTKTEIGKVTVTITDFIGVNSQYKSNGNGNVSGFFKTTAEENVYVFEQECTGTFWGSIFYIYDQTTGNYSTATTRYIISGSTITEEGTYGLTKVSTGQGTVGFNISDVAGKKVRVTLDLRDEDNPLLRVKVFD